MLLTQIPYFREVIVVSFRCDHCGNSNNEIQSAGQIQPRGSIYTVKCTSPSDLDRSLVRSEHCSIVIPELELTIPAAKGQLTTVEGVINDTIADLAADQPVRKHVQPEVHDKIEALLDRLRVLVAEEDDQGRKGDERELRPFTIKLDDPSGNSFIEAVGGMGDPKWSKRDFSRSKDQNLALGLVPKDEEDGSAGATETKATLTDDYQGENPESVYSFPTTCSSCGAVLETYMKTVAIPHFKDVILMSTNCHSCGYRDNEIKSGGAISPLGRKLTLRVEDSEDLARDVLKSETASLTIPELELHLNPGTLGGRFTTLEGLLGQIHEELDERVFARGDSTIPGKKGAMETFLENLKAAMSAEKPYTVVLDDPLANSYIQNLYAPDPDPNLEEEEYERTFEQQEDLGLNDMKTEGYEKDAVEGVQGLEVKDTQEKPAEDVGAETATA